MRYIIIYDISDDKSRKETRKALKSYGAWKQYSAFEVDLSKTQYTELKHKLKEIISSEEHIRIYPLTPTNVDNIEEIGKTTDDEQSTVV
ncbi:CRISPR-associated endonuclease Cas2 [Candidatus Nanohalococcus occultus]|uniref:CRISPR-associated endoribonuclease Cas2 n=1 Tax=Candidatus Nanohalococcus occultus TaxID=2978047 RepID=A0ABY8CJ51_9ARCH|nr:CRISPR-associated protein Cas2 [Candidatus Nanohaloarchaeota archaeon SVXNc]